MLRRVLRGAAGTRPLWPAPRRALAKAADKKAAAAAEKAEKEAPAASAKGPTPPLPLEQKLEKLNLYYKMRERYFRRKHRDFKHVDIEEAKQVIQDADEELFYTEPDMPPPPPGDENEMKILQDSSNAELSVLEKETTFKKVFPFFQHVGTYTRRRTTAEGRVNSQTALVIAGNGRGLVGWGVGRGNDEMSALNKAKTMVTKNCIYVPRFEGRTIPYVVIGKHNNTRVKLVPKLRGATMVASPLMGTILDMAGMRDISAKVLGNRNIFSQIYAVFDALSKVPSIPEHTRARGHKVYRFADPSLRPKRPSAAQLRKIREQINELVSSVQERSVLMRYNIRQDQNAKEIEKLSELPPEQARSLVS